MAWAGIMGRVGCTMKKVNEVTDNDKIAQREKKVIKQYSII